MRSARFRAEREAAWRRLEALVGRSEARGVRSLSFEEARELATLYRSAVNALSVARAISLDRALLDYLEGLSARAYLAVYAPPQSLGGLAGRFLGGGAPAAVRRLALPILIALVAMALGGLSGYALFFENPAWFDVIVARSPGDPRGPEATREELMSVIRDEDAGPLGGLAAFASFLFSHNARIAFFAFGLGAFLALPTVLLIYYNGMVLGAYFALHVDRGIGLELLGWLSIHGVTEIAAIVLAAGAGLALGGAVLFPGRRTRADALREAGRPAVKVALVAVLMLLAAALLEGFGRQLVTGTETRLAIGWGIGLLWLGWILRGRSA